MKLQVDPDKCQGHARCHAVCPELFAIADVSGKSSVKLDPVPERLHALAERAVRSCPEDAIAASD